MYIKKFDEWNYRKKLLDKKEQRDFFYEKEIWWCSLGLNIGSEQDGKNNLFERPVLIFKKFSKDTLLVFPLTRKQPYKKYSFKIDKDNHSYVILSQIKLISSKRLLRKMSIISRREYLLILLKFIKIIILS